MNENDHFSPQGYLRGFIHPQRLRHQKPLWVFDIRHSTWARKSPKGFGYELGFYDYSADSEADATAEDVFKQLENNFPVVRERIRNARYANWTDYREVLVSFAAMLAARSRLFRFQAESQILSSLGDRPGRTVLAKNYSITTMRAEIQRRADEWQAYHWALGYTTNPDRPVIASDQSVGMRGDDADQRAAYERHDFWLWFPVSWDMCLIGSSKPLSTKPTAELEPQHIAELQALTRQQARLFLVSPVQLAGIAA